MSEQIEIEGLQIGEAIGAGGYAVVHAAHLTATGAPVAVKILRKSLAGENEAVLRVLQEGRLAWSINHPNVVRVLSSGVTAGRRAYVVMERLEGETLDERMAREGPLDWRAVLAVAVAVTRGLAVIHRRGAIHRDIKPGNIFLCRGLDPLEGTKVLDLGIARLAVHDPDRLLSTRKNEVVGTPGYLPPERLREEDDPRGDLYSLGVVLFEALTGRPLYTGSPMQVALQVLRCEVAPTLHREDVPAELRAVVAHCMAPRKEDRPADAAALLEALVALAAGPAGAALEEGLRLRLESLGAGLGATTLRGSAADAGWHDLALRMASGRLAPHLDRRVRHVAALDEDRLRLAAEEEAAQREASALTRRLSEETALASGRLHDARAALRQAEAGRLRAVALARRRQLEDADHQFAEAAAGLGGGVPGAAEVDQLPALASLAAEREALHHQVREAEAAAQGEAAEVRSQGDQVAQLEHTLAGLDLQRLTVLDEVESRARALGEALLHVDQDRAFEALALRVALRLEAVSASAR